jgi:mannose-6-phosphate isomerase-like protein (cupin superfamily)
LIKFKEDLKLDITKVNHLPNVVEHIETLDFNKLLLFLDRNEDNFYQKREHAFKLTHFETFKEGQDFQTEVKKIHDYRGEKIDTYIFASLCKKGITPCHHDEMSVFLIPTYGDVVYNVYTEEGQHIFFLKKGDLLTIPKGVVHSAIPLNSRIVVSVGVYN